MTHTPIHPRILARLKNNLAARKERLSQRQLETVAIFEAALTRLLESDMPEDQRARCIALYRRILSTLRGLDPNRSPERWVMFALAAELEAAHSELARTIGDDEERAKPASPSTTRRDPDTSS